MGGAFKYDCIPEHVVAGSIDLVRRSIDLCLGSIDLIRGSIDLKYGAFKSRDPSQQWPGSP